MVDRKVLLIVAVGLSLRLFSFAGLMGSDDLIYNQAAYNLTVGEDFALGNPGQNRLGLILPLAASFRLWGVNEASSSLVTLIPSLLLLFLIFHIANRLFCREAGYIAALLSAVYPMDVLFSTRLYPDLPMSLFTGLGVYLFYRGCRDKGGLYLFMSGICVGLAYSIKMTGAFAIPFLMGYAVYAMRKEGKIRWDFLLAPLGFLAVFGSELFFFYAYKGDMFFRFHSLAVHNQGRWSGLDFFREHGYLARLVYMYPLKMLFQFTFFGLFYWATLAAAVYLLAVREKRAYFPMAWWLALYLTLNFTSTSLSEYIPLPPHSRYSFMLLLPANLILAMALWRLTRGEQMRKWVRAAGYSIIVVLLLSSILIAGKGRERGADVERAVSSYFNRNPDKPIYTDPRTVKILSYYFKYKNLDMIRDFRPIELNDLKDSYVVVNIPRLRFLRDAYKQRFNPALLLPPPSWKPVAIFNPDKDARGRPLFNRKATVIYAIE